MDELFSALPKEEQVTLTLRRMFERLGYRRYRMSNFEAYDMYLANKSFLDCGGILTVTDGTGRLLALKPDVTMSIVKNTRADAVQSKLYYMENVFRTARGGAAIREISQMGVEYIGTADGYAEAEVVHLAQESLAAICPDSVLNVSHMGFVTGFLDALNLNGEAQAALLAAVRGKNAHTLRALALENGCSEAQAEALAGLAQLAGPYADTLARARTLVCAPAMAAALDALQTLYDTLCAVDAAKLLRLDFSLLNDTDYYNGLVLQGFVQGVPRAVLAGGRYDHLMRRFGKPQTALGFALYLGEVERMLAGRAPYDVDVLLLYDAAAAPALAAQTVRALAAEGKSVRAAASMPENVRARMVLRLNADGRTEVVSC